MEDKLKQEIIDLLKENEQKDSIEIGNSKTGVIKVYCDFNKPVEAEQKIKQAITFLKEHRTGVFE